MRVVLDSNVYVSAALSVEGHSRSILELAEKSLFEISIADSITDEIERPWGQLWHSWQFSWLSPLKVFNRAQYFAAVLRGLALSEAVLRLEM